MDQLQYLYHCRFKQLFQTEENAQSLMSWLTEIKFFEQPASTKFHSNFPQGLAQHVLIFTEILEQLIAVLPSFQTTYGEYSLANKVTNDTFRPFIVALGHDLTKASRYNVNKKRALVNGAWTDVLGYEYKKFDSPFPDNMDCLNLISEKICLSELERVAIYWAEGAFQLIDNKKMISGFNAAMAKDVRVYLTTVADMLSSQYIEKTLTDSELSDILKK